MFLYELLGWIDVVLAICGLGICIRYSRLSDRMAWLAIAFGISACTGTGNRLASLAVAASLLPAESLRIVYAVSGLGNIVASALLVFGLLGVLKDVRERFQFMREAYEDRQESTPTRTTPRESVFDTTDPTP